MIPICSCLQSLEPQMPWLPCLTTYHWVFKTGLTQATVSCYGCDWSILLPSSVGSEEELTGTPCLSEHPHFTALAAPASEASTSFSSWRFQIPTPALSCDGDALSPFLFPEVQCSTARPGVLGLRLSLSLLWKVERQAPHHYPVTASSRVESINPYKETPVQDVEGFLSAHCHVSPLLTPTCTIIGPSNNCHKKKHLFLHTSFRGWRSHSLQIF